MKLRWTRIVKWSWTLIRQLSKQPPVLFNLRRLEKLPYQITNSEASALMINKQNLCCDLKNVDLCKQNQKGIVSPRVLPLGHHAVIWFEQNLRLRQIEITAFFCCAFCAVLNIPLLLLNLFNSTQTILKSLVKLLFYLRPWPTLLFPVPGSTELNINLNVCQF